MSLIIKKEDKYFIYQDIKMHYNTIREIIMSEMQEVDL